MTSEQALSAISYRIISDNESLDRACDAWLQAEALGMDTEFMRVSTYYPVIGLIQVADDNGITLIDPLGISDWQPFAAILSNTAITKVMHSCSEDLLVFHTFAGVIPEPVFDTQIAAALLGEGLSLSYQNLVINGFGIELPKDKTRSDWLQRPLTTEQLEYAALDVSYLLRSWRQQKGELDVRGRLAWLEEECRRMRRQYDTEISGDFSGFYLNFKAAWQLGPHQLAALRYLAEWREQRARKRDRPRNWIIKDSALFAIARSLCSSKAQLGALEDVSDNFIRHEGEKVLALVAKAKDLSEAECPSLLPKPLNQRDKQHLRAVRSMIESKAAELGLVPELLLRRKTLLALLYALKEQGGAGNDRELEVPEELRGWRAPLLLDELLGELQK